MPTNVSFLRTAKKRLSHSFHAFFWHTRPSCTFSFTKAPLCLKLLIPASNAIGRWGITVELSPECPLNRNNWFVLHKLQQTKHLLLRSRLYRFVTSQTKREEGSGIAHAHKTWTPAVSCGKLISACVLKAVMAGWKCANYFDTPCTWRDAQTEGRKLERTKQKKMKLHQVPGKKEAWRENMEAVAQLGPPLTEIKNFKKNHAYLFTSFSH